MRAREGRRGMGGQFARRMVAGRRPHGAGAGPRLGGADHGRCLRRAPSGGTRDCLIERPRAGDARRRGDYVCRVETRRSDRRRRCDRLGTAGNLPAAVVSRHAIRSRPRPLAAWSALRRGRPRRRGEPWLSAPSRARSATCAPGSRYRWAPRPPCPPSKPKRLAEERKDKEKGPVVPATCPRRGLPPVFAAPSRMISVKTISGHHSNRSPAECA